MNAYLELNFGKSFTGKTARMLWELREEGRVILADPKCAQLVDLKNWDHLWPVYDSEENVWMGKDFVDYFRKRQNCRFRAMVHFRTHFSQQLNLLCRLSMGVKNLALAVDEMGLFIPSGSVNSLPPSITAAAISGRHEFIKFTGTAQLPSLVHFVVRSNAERIRWFRLTEKNALDVARLHMDENFVQEVANLPDYICVETSDFALPFRDESLVGKIKILAKKPSSAHRS